MGGIIEEMDRLVNELTPVATNPKVYKAIDRAADQLQIAIKLWPTANNGIRQRIYKDLQKEKNKLQNLVTLFVRKKN